MKVKNHQKRKQNSINNHHNNNNKNKKDYSFFNNKNSKRRRFEDAEIDSDFSDDGGDDFFVDEDNINNSEGKGADEEDDELERETVEERRLRLAKEFVAKVKKSEEQEDEDTSDDDDDDRVDKRGLRDSLVAKLLQQDQLEESGRVRRLIASKLKKPEDNEGLQLVIKHRQSVTSVALSDDDGRGFSASKDGCLTHWDVETRKIEKYCWPSQEVLKSHGMKEPHRQGSKHSKNTLALAVSSDGRYLATGGLDRHIHLWDTRTREHIKTFSGHRGPVSCLAFRQGTLELFSGSFDRAVKIWNAEDRLYISTVCCHHSEIVGIDCLRKERSLTVGRDRMMVLLKVPEESQLIYRSSTSSLECCCFVGNDEFLTGSDDGSIELWNILRKKPVSIVRNAHVTSTFNIDGRISNGHIEGSEPQAKTKCSSAQSWVGSVTVCRNSDLAASGAGNGYVRLWDINSETRVVSPLFSIPLAGYVNSLAIAKSGRFLVAGVGQEPRLGRWDRIATAKNGVALQSFKFTS